MKLIAGLGNPGSKYEWSRHNLGFLVIDNILKTYSLSLDKKTKNSLYIKTSINGLDLVLLKPQTYMNLSGYSILEIKDFYKIDLKNIIIIQDDIDLPFNTIRIKTKGSHGGHNGIKSIISILNSENFIRVKGGIGRPENNNFPIENYVLSNFNEQEKLFLNDFINKLSLAVIKIITAGVNEAMCEFNRTGF